MTGIHECNVSKSMPATELLTEVGVQKYISGNKYFKKL
jgi:hypothetical protein